MGNPGKKKIGFIFDELPLADQALDMFARIESIAGLEIVLVQNTFPGKLRFGLKRKFFEYGLVSFINKSFFAASSTLEQRFVRRDSPNDPPMADLSGRKLIQITPLPSKRNLFYRYSNEDIERLRGEEFDLLVRGDGRGIVKGEILDLARDGFLSLHYGDNRVLRGVPAGYWEVYFKHPATGFIIQILNEVLDGGHVIARGSGATEKFYTRNWYAIRSRAHDKFQSIMQDYAKTGNLPARETGDQPLGKLLTIPHIGQVFNYIRGLFT